MLIKAPKNSRDYSEFHHDSPALDRRKFLAGTAALGVASFIGGQMLASEVAYGAALQCPPSTLMPGGFGQIYMSGGGCSIIGIYPERTANAINATSAASYGITGTSTVTTSLCGGNWYTSTDSVWGKVLQAGPPGVNAQTWAAILKKTFIGGSNGDLGQDDGNGQNEGLVSGFALINGKGGPNPKDFRFGGSATPASYVVGPNASLTGNNASPAGLASTVSMTPAATGLTTSADLAAVNVAALAIENAYEAVNPVSAKKGGQTLLNNAGCGFNNNPPTASTTYGTSNYTPSQISAITNLIPAASIATMSLQNQAILAAAYNSATGFNAGVILTTTNNDYHQQSATNIASVDLQNALACVAMIAGFAAANQNGVIQLNSNGFCISNGTQPATVTINGATVDVNVAGGGSNQNDGGGFYSQNLLLFCNNVGPAIAPTMLGSINATDGKATGAAGSPANSMAGNAASVLAYLNGGTIPQKFLTASGLTAAQLAPLMTLS